MEEKKEEKFLEEPQDPIEKTEENEEIALLKLQLTQMQQKLLYAYADIENIRRNKTKEIQGEKERGIGKVILSFLTVLDDFERCRANEKKDSPLHEGFSMIYQSFLRVLSEHNVVEIATNNDYDPMFHEIIAVVPSDNDASDIVSVVRKGYLFNNTVLRPAQVTVREKK